MGTLTLIDPESVQLFDNSDSVNSVNLPYSDTINHDSVNVNNKGPINRVKSSDVNNQAHVQEVLSKVKCNSDQLTKDQELELKGLISEYVDIFQVEGALEVIILELNMKFSLITNQLGPDLTVKHLVFKLKLGVKLKKCLIKILLESQQALGHFLFA